MDNSIIHILVIWSKAQSYKTQIMEDLRKDFSILKIFQGHWEKDKFLQNYMVFYAHSQYHLSPEAYRDLLQGKVEHCGDDDFTVVILRDDHPHFETRMTSSGERKVNTRMFDKKTQYRALTGGGHKIHSSDDAWETNHDLTLMFGRNTEDFCKHYTLDGNEDTLSQNCKGIGGYPSIEEFFYVLNNTIRYVVMRNHECIPDQYTVEGHGDIDLLCENKNWMAYLTAAKKIFPEPYRVYHTIMIGGVEVPFDFRYAGDNYYDQPWQEDILNTRVLTKNLFYTPNAEHQFYSLLYHAYVQKWEVKEDYPPKLRMYADNIGESYRNDVQSAMNLLDGFFAERHYEYVKPVDESVVYNENNLQQSTHWLENGTLLKHRYNDPEDDREYETSVYRLPDRYRKVGSLWLIHNEYLYTLQANERGVRNIPQILRYEETGNCALIETSPVSGVPVSEFITTANYTLDTWRTLLLGALDIMEQLAHAGIAHRDLMIQNLLVSGDGLHTHVNLIDFGWASDLDHIADNRPVYLAYPYAPTRTETDFQTFGFSLQQYVGRLQFVRRFAMQLQQMDYATVSDSVRLAKALKKIRRSLNCISLRDRIQLFAVHHCVRERFFNCHK